MTRGPSDPSSWHMSGYLWKNYLEDDVESFRQLLANADHNARPHAQKGASGGVGTSAGTPIGSPGTALASSPKLTARHRKVSAWTPGSQAAGSKPQKTGAQIRLGRSDINSTDAHGMTVLHHAASSPSSNSIVFATALLEVPSVDLYIQDTENAWTALHRVSGFHTIRKGEKTEDTATGTLFREHHHCPSYHE